MKIAIDKHKTVKDNNYCVRVTSDEGEIGRAFLEAFQNNDRDIPTILTSSKMLDYWGRCQKCTQCCVNRTYPFYDRVQADHRARH